MKVSEKIQKFQAGGPAPAPDASGAPDAAAPDQSQGGAPAGADAGQGGQDPVTQLVQLAQQALEGQDCQAAMAVCDGLLSLIQQSQGGAQGGAPGGDASQGGAPAPGGAPVYRAGGRLTRRIN